MGPRAATIGLGMLATALACGCGSVKTSSTPRTGTEQLLLTNAWDSALSKVDFRPLTGVPVFLDATNLQAIDQGYVVSSIRQAMLAQGVLLREKKEQAQWVVEASVGAYGTDAKNWMIGIPQVTVPPTVTGIPTGTVPEMPLVKKSNQQGVAKLLLFAYDRSSGQLTWRSGTTIATASAKDTYIGGVGPIHSDTIRGGAEFGGLKIPLPGESPRPRRPGPPPEDPSALAIPPSASDLDAFAP